MTPSASQYNALKNPACQEAIRAQLATKMAEFESKNSVQQLKGFEHIAQYPARSDRIDPETIRGKKVRKPKRAFSGEISHTVERAVLKALSEGPQQRSAIYLKIMDLLEQHAPNDKAQRYRLLSRTICFLRHKGLIEISTQGWKLTVGAV